MHTPGPWNIDPSSGEDIIFGHDCSVVAQALGDNFPANALLIAAAPDMLAALEATMDLLRAGAPIRTGGMIAAAIAKTTPNGCANPGAGKGSAASVATDQNADANKAVDPATPGDAQ